MSEDQKKYCIYAAEKRIGKDIGGHYLDWWHAFVFLMDESKGSGVKGQMVQELHFNNDEDLRMVPELLQKERPREWMEDLKLLPLVGGKEEDILPLWNHILQMAHEMKKQQVEFGEDFIEGPEDVNCRTLVVCALEAMDMDVDLFYDFARSAAGLCADAPPRHPVYSLHVAKPEPLMLSRTKNEILTAGLE